MKVALIDVDGHNYPNLALMKISAFHRMQGDRVEWYDPMFTLTSIRPTPNRKREARGTV